MSETAKQKKVVLNAVLDLSGRYVRLVDGKGKSLAYIMAEEISVEEKPALQNEFWIAGKQGELADAGK